jgi:YebC/PmpR family DNA-binding regulatory protein
MSGHSKWATIKRAKGKADAARGKLFNKLIREITIAARMGGGDKETNIRLRTAVANARSSNMPNKNIETAIMKGTGQLEGVSYEEATFEAYAPGGVALLIDCLSDNRNRTVSEVRHVLTKAGGSMGSTNSVNWMFHTKGVITVETATIDEDTLMEVALENGAEDMTSEDDVYEITTSQEAFAKVRDALEKRDVAMASAEIRKVPENLVKVTGEDALKVMRLIDTLDDLDDTQNVYTNADFADEDVEAYQNDKA